MRKNSVRILAVVMAVVMLFAQVVAPVSAASAGDEGFCSVCGTDGIVGDDLIAHRDPTCDNNGYDLYECNNEVDGVNCPGQISVVIDATNQHVANPEDVHDAVAPTCTEDGNVAYSVCKDCGQKFDANGDVLTEVVVKAPGHDLEKTGTVDSTCEVEGYETWSCKNCEYEEKRSLGHAAHTYVTVPAKEPNCYDKGYEEYEECSVCGDPNPEKPFKELDVVDHGVYHAAEEDLAPTCTEDGYKVFKCTVDTCTYFNGRREVVSKTNHKGTVVTVEAKPVTCLEDGYSEHKKCTACGVTQGKVDYTARGYHTQVAVGYKAPTCTEDGSFATIKCDACDLVYVAADVIPALGHSYGAWIQTQDPTCTEKGIETKTCSVCGATENRDVAAIGHTFGERITSDDGTGTQKGMFDAVESTCYKKGNIACKRCDTCRLMFAADVSNDKTVNWTVAGMSDEEVFLPMLDHNFRTDTKAPTCTETGLSVKTCQNDGCTIASSEVIPALGHDFEFVAEVPAKCEVDGTKAHNKCKACNKKFAADADPMNLEIVEVADADLVIPGLDHVEKVVDEVPATFDAPGRTAGKVCEVCGESLLDADEIPVLNEEITFTYEALGINGSSVATNSGFITLNVYMNVNTDIARLYGLNFALFFNENLTLVDFAESKLFEVLSTNEDTLNLEKYLGIANEANLVKFSQNMGTAYEDVVFEKGEYLFATLTFKVDKAFTAEDVEFAFDEETGASFVRIGNKDAEGNVTPYINELTVDFVADAYIDVVVLGDANDDDKIDTVDAAEFAKWFAFESADEDAYDTVFDLDKDGAVTALDFQLLQNAIVGDNDYLDM